MAGSVNKVTILGNVGNEPEIKTLNSGDQVANLTVATSETWKDKSTGEKKEKTEWHRIVVFGGVVEVIKNYVKKGSKVYIEGALQTRKWQNAQGVDQYSTEIVLKPFNGTLVLLGDPRGEGGQSGGGRTQEPAQQRQQTRAQPDVDDEIPF